MRLRAEQAAGPHYEHVLPSGSTSDRGTRSEAITLTPSVASVIVKGIVCLVAMSNEIICCRNTLREHRK
jgi:hypothetical protein